MTSLKPLGIRLLTAWAAEFRRVRVSVEQSWCPKEATTYENVELVRRSDRRCLHDTAREIGKILGHFSLS